MKSVLTLLIFIFMLFGPVALAQEDNSPYPDQWTIGQVSGLAHIEVPGREPMAIKAGRVLYPGQTLTTGARTRLVMTNGKQRIQVSSNTVLSLPSWEELKPDMTVIRQSAGTISLSVDKQKKQHFRVETPYMVAAVKGTEFTVSLDDVWANVRVHQGLVEVRNTVLDEVFDVKAGETAALKVADLRALLLRQTSGETANQTGDFLSSAFGRMTLIKRGENSPEDVQASSREPSGLAGMVGETVAGLLAVLFDYVAGGVDAAYGWVNGMLVDLLSPFFDLTDGFSGLNYWVRVALFGLLAGVTLGVGSLYFVFFRRR